MDSGAAETVLNRLESNVFPWIGSRPVIEIKTPELLMVLRRIESRGALETAHRVGLSVVRFSGTLWPQA